MAIRRAADGSAFQKCEECGVMIAIALFDMHECGEKRREVKRLKCVIDNNISKPSFEEEPRSPFVFFLEDIRKIYGWNIVEGSRICLMVWKKMSEEDRSLYLECAAEVDLAHNRKLNEESKRIYKADDDEADSKDVDKLYDRYDHEEEEHDSSDHFEHEFLWEDDTLPKY